MDRTRAAEEEIRRLREENTELRVAVLKEREQREREQALIQDERDDIQEAYEVLLKITKRWET